VGELAQQTLLDIRQRQVAGAVVRLHPLCILVADTCTATSFAVCYGTHKRARAMILTGLHMLECCFPFPDASFVPGFLQTTSLLL